MSDKISSQSIDIDRLINLIEHAPEKAIALLERRRKTSQKIAEMNFCIACDNEYTRIDYFYTVTKSTWAEAGLTDGFMHLTCLSKKLGRKLTKDDFTEYPINNIVNAVFECCEL